MKTLKSKLFKKEPNQKLKDCLNLNSGHISLKDNSTGEHVERIQIALTKIKEANPSLGIPLFTVNGRYDSATAAAVLKYKQKRDVVNHSYQQFADNIVGQMTIERLDGEMELIELGRGGHLIPIDPVVQKELAKRDSSLALSWVNAAIAAIATYKTALTSTLAGLNAPLPPKTSEALDTHFHLIDPKPSISGSVRRSITSQDVQLIESNLNAVRGVLSNQSNFENSTGFIDKTGKPIPSVPAHAPFGGHIFFDPPYKDFTDAVGASIGSNSRAAILIHEATHVIDRASAEDINHISEFTTQYENMNPNNMLHNSSSYASFAAMIATGHGKQRADRFGLGPLRSS